MYEAVLQSGRKKKRQAEWAKKYGLAPRYAKIEARILVLISRRDRGLFFRYQLSPSKRDGVYNRELS